MAREDPHHGWDQLLLKTVGKDVWGLSVLPRTDFSASGASAFLKVVQCIWGKQFLILLLLLQGEMGKLLETSTDGGCCRRPSGHEGGGSRQVCC